MSDRVESRGDGEALGGDAVDYVDPTLEVERRIGTARGISVEVLTCAERRKILLVVSPTVRAMTILAEGRLDEVEVFARVGICVLRALDEVIPLVSGEAFQMRAQRVVAPASSGSRQ